MQDEICMCQCDISMFTAPRFFISHKQLSAFRNSSPVVLSHSNIHEPHNHTTLLGAFLRQQTSLAETTPAISRLSTFPALLLPLTG